MRAYVYDTADTADQRAPHDAGIEKSVDDLSRIGVLYWRFDGPDATERLDKLALERQYKNRDQVCLSFCLLFKYVLLTLLSDCSFSRVLG